VARFSLFLLLVVLVPLGVYWAGNAGSFERLPEEMRELRGTRPEPVPTPAPEKAPEKPPEPEKPSPPPPKPPDPPPVRVDAEKLFREGKFREAAAAFLGVDERKRSLALLGEAFALAFPEGLPDRPYLLLRTRTGEVDEGFGEKAGGRVTVVDAAGKSFAFPESALSEERELPREQVKERIAKQARDSTDIAGPRIFALIQAACAAGRPDAAATLLEPALEADEKEPYFLSTVRARVPSERQKDMYRAFATAQAPAVMAEPDEPAPVVKQPVRPNRPKPAPDAPASGNPKVRALMEEAAPHRKQGEKLYREIVIKGADASTADAVNEALREFDKALALYEKAVEIEESDGLYAILQSSSRLRFHLAFWKQQLEGR
jgi:tetratricopeptide (TPR) repeat protein